MTRLIALLLLLALGGRERSLASSWYASPSALGTGNGSLTNPWPLQVALTNPAAAIQPGDTLYLLGGQYRGPGFVSTLAGTSSNYVTVRSQPGEWAVITDGMRPVLLTALAEAAAYTTTRDVTIAGTETATVGNVVILEGEQVQLNARRNTPTNWNIVRGWGGTTPTAHTINTLGILKADFITQKGSYVVFRGFEITSALSSNRVVGTSNALGCGLNLISSGKGNKAINLIIHNTGHPGIGFWQQGDGGEINGCLLWGNGMYDNDGTWIRGSAIYSQNAGGLATIKNCINFRNLTTGGKVFGEGGPVLNFQFIGNLAFANGASPLEGASGSTSTSNLWFTGNIMTGTPLLGYQSLSNRAQYFINNIIVNGVFSTKEHADSVYTNNTVFFPKNSVGDTDQTMSYSSAHYPADALNIVWDRNTYYFGVGSINDYMWSFTTEDVSSTNALGGGRLKFLNDSGKAWKDWSGFDANTTYEAQWPSNYLNIVAQPLDYDPNRWHICVINTTPTTNATLNLAALGFTSGQRYVLRDAQNYFTVLTDAVYTSGNITLPLRLTNVATIPGVTNFVNKHTNVDEPGLFNAFVLTRGTGLVPPSNLRPVN